MLESKQRNCRNEADEESMKIYTPRCQTELFPELTHKFIEHAPMRIYHRPIKQTAHTDFTQAITEERNLF